MVRFPLPGPADLFRVADRGYEAIEKAIALVPRIGGLIEQIEQIARRADAVISDVDRTRRRADRVVDQTARTVEAADLVLIRTGLTVEAAEQLLGRATALLDGFEPSLNRLAPLAQQLADTTSPAEVTALIGLIDHLPLLVAALETDILPILSTLGTVGPDVRDLLDTTREFNEILGSVPGLGRIKKRVEERQEQEDQQQLQELRARETEPQ